MLIPRFSIRFILALMTGLGLFFLLASLALRGHQWATPIVVAGISLFICFVFYGLCFTVAWIVSRWMKAERRSPKSPFAQDTMPPQFVPPEDPT